MSTSRRICCRVPGLQEATHAQTVAHSLIWLLWTHPPPFLAADLFRICARVQELRSRDPNVAMAADGGGSAEDADAAAIEGGEWAVRVSLLELYNESLRDLLAAAGGTAAAMERLTRGAPVQVRSVVGPDIQLLAVDCSVLCSVCVVMRTIGDCARGGGGGGGKNRGATLLELRSVGWGLTCALGSCSFLNALI